MVSIMRDKLGITKNAKLTVDVTAPVQVSLNKMFRYVSKNSDYEIKLNDAFIFKMLESVGYKVKQKYSSLEEILEDKNRLGSVKSAVGLSDEKNVLLLECVNAELGDKDSKSVLIMVNLENTSPKTKTGFKLSFNSNPFKSYVPSYFVQLNVDRLYAVYTIKNYSEFRKYLSLTEVSNEEELEMLRSRVLIDKYFSSKYRYKGKEKDYLDCMYLSVLRAYRKDLNYKLMQNYEKGRVRDYATVFQTKKNITKKIQHEMETSPFLKHFTYVELDNEVDIDKYKSTFPHFESLMNQMTVPLNKSQLRFRKLGKLSVGGYKVNGVYFPKFKCIALDIRDVGAFVHELAHSIDYEAGGGEPLSLKDDFQDIIEHYTNNFSILAKKNEMSQANIQYFITPTEIFARGFELAFVLRGNKNVLVGNPNKFNEIQFTAFKGIEEELKQYYSKFMR